MLREATGIRKIYLRAGRTDLRKGIYSLQAMIQMVFEGDGWLIMTKHLIGGNRFQWPRNSGDTLNLTREQYCHLMDGFTIDGTIRHISGQNPSE